MAQEIFERALPTNSFMPGWAFLTNIYLNSLKQVDGDPGRVADDEHHHDGQQ